MLIRLGYDIELGVTGPTALIALLLLHPDREADVVEPESLTVDPPLPADPYTDVFGNRCLRIQVPADVDRVRLRNHFVIRDSGDPDPVESEALQHSVADLPTDVLTYLLPSRYCEVDSQLLQFAWDTFGTTPLGWARVQAVCDFVHGHLQFDYQSASVGRTALGGFTEKRGVCRDFAHLAITLCRCLNIPARYVTGYLGDIRVEPLPGPMDFSAWFEVYLGGAWRAFDARHNSPRIGRTAIGRGRDAADVPITMVFGPSTLNRFHVVSEEIDG
jgi:transglutaminase-like putative cysteine protease